MPSVKIPNNSTKKTKHHPIQMVMNNFRWIIQYEILEDVSMWNIMWISRDIHCKLHTFCTNKSFENQQTSLFLFKTNKKKIAWHYVEFLISSFPSAMQKNVHYWFYNIQLELETNKMSPSNFFNPNQIEENTFLCYFK